MKKPPPCGGGSISATEMVGETVCLHSPIIEYDSARSIFKERVTNNGRGSKDEGEEVLEHEFLSVVVVVGQNVLDLSFPCSALNALCMTAGPGVVVVTRAALVPVVAYVPAGVCYHASHSTTYLFFVNYTL